MSEYTIKPRTNNYLDIINTSTDRCVLTFTRASDNTNCKLSYLHGLGCLKTVNDEVKLIALNLALGYSRGCVIINTITKSVADFIAKHYPVYYYHKVPIGYQKGYQYHICIKNTIKENFYCRKPILRSSLNKRNKNG